jgi:hypothetical protein
MVGYLLELDVRGELVASLDGSHCEVLLVFGGVSVGGCLRYGGGKKEEEGREGQIWKLKYCTGLIIYHAINSGNHLNGRSTAALSYLPEQFQMQVRSVCHLPLSLAVEGLEPQLMLKSVDVAPIASATSVRYWNTPCTSKMLRQDLLPNRGISLDQI